MQHRSLVTEACSRYSTELSGMASFTGSRSLYVGPDGENDLKPMGMVELIEKEVGLDLYGVKPKEAIKLINAKIGREGGAGNPKEELQACRAAIRALPSSFWSDEVVGVGRNAPANLVRRLAAKPATCGGFTATVAAPRLNAKAVDTKAVSVTGACTIDGITILTPPGSYNKLDFEIENISRLFGSQRDAEKLGDASFKVASREQVTPGTTVMVCKALQCSARFAALQTPKFLLLGIYSQASPEADILALLEEVRVESTTTPPPEPEPEPEPETEAEAATVADY